MSDLSIVEVLNTVPDGVTIDLRRNRMTALIGLAVSQYVPIPAGRLDGVNRTSYFAENTAQVRDTLYRMNEVVPFSVDRVLEIAYQVWNLRYRLVHECTPDILLGSGALANNLVDIIPGMDQLQITANCINNVSALIKQQNG